MGLLQAAVAPYIYITAIETWELPRAMRWSNAGYGRDKRLTGVITGRLDINTGRKVREPLFKTSSFTPLLVFIHTGLDVAEIHHSSPVRWKGGVGGTVDSEAVLRSVEGTSVAGSNPRTLA
ncbi:hypothetical protein PoB_003751000 [Plakobranchus ocellatus]|uniref:Uncharacterized protein n=1 Tax=Plakobranchus ocellatus TaxID=259542 RepID=A0AAV4ART6_9GAST|nr:hypothetical protein PoB_003751000 [Plakobranchus ocellatus]